MFSLDKEEDAVANSEEEVNLPQSSEIRLVPAHHLDPRILSLLKKIDSARTILHNITITIRKLSAHSKLKSVYEMLPDVFDEYLLLIKYLKRETLISLLFVSPLPDSVEHWQLPQRVFLDLDIDLSDRELTLKVTKFVSLKES